MHCADSCSKWRRPRAHYTDDVSGVDLRLSCASSLIEQQRGKLPPVWVTMRCVHACAASPPIVTLGLCSLPQMGSLSTRTLWRLVPSAWQPVTALWCWFFFFYTPPLPEEMVSDWEQCVNSPVTLDKPARRPVTGTYGMFDRERGCESHWMIKWCFSPFGNVMLSGKRADHRSLKRLTPASLWHLLQGPGLLSLAPRPILTLTVCAARSCSASLSECGTIIGYQFSLAMQAGERIHPKSALPLKLSKAAPAVLHPVSPRPVTRLTFLINTRTVSSSRC